MLIDRYLPVYTHRTVHSRAIAATPEAVYAATRTLDFSASWLTRGLLALRGFGVAEPNLAALRQVLQFEPLDESAPHELVMGGVYPLQRLSPEAYLAHARPGLKMAWNFSVTPTPTGSLLRTETRVLCIGARIQRRFGLYWLFIRPFSGLIRHELLRCVALTVEVK